MTLRRLASLATALAVLAVLAGPAWSARVVEVRVGNHPKFTRVVFELDAPAGYRIERRAAGGESELVIELSAASAPREVKSRSAMVEGVAIEQSGAQSIARVQLRRSAPRVKELILGGPPRIVLDFMLPDEAVREAAAPAEPKPAAEPAREAPRTVAKTEEPEAKAPRLEPEVRPEPALAKPPRVDLGKPDTAPAPKLAAEMPAPAVEAARPEPPTTKTPVHEPVEEAPLAGVESALEGERIVRPKVDRPDVPEPAAAAVPAEGPSAPAFEAPQPSAEPAKPTAPKVVAKAPAPPTSAGPKAKPTGPFGLKLDGADPWLTLGLVGGGLIAFLVVVTMLLRRHSKPTSLDALEMAREFEEPVGSGAAFETIAAGERATEHGVPFPAAGPGSFEDEREKGESEMDVAAELPVERGARGAMIASAIGSEADLGSVVQELQRRMGQLESRLEEANEARERLERQVTAQSEELRVQRAAIARTQRALRGMTRTGEEQATEPALRDPSKPTAGRG